MRVVDRYVHEAHVILIKYVLIHLHPGSRLSVLVCSCRVQSCPRPKRKKNDMGGMDGQPRKIRQDC